MCMFKLYQIKGKAIIQDLFFDILASSERWSLVRVSMNMWGALDTTIIVVNVFIVEA